MPIAASEPTGDGDRGAPSDRGSGADSPGASGERDRPPLGTPEGRVGSMFLRALEPSLGGDAVIYTLRLREPIDPLRLARAYERHVRARAGLRVDYVEDTARRRFIWAPIEPQDLEARLARALADLDRIASADEPLAPAPVEAQLPYRLLRLDEHTLVVQLSHVLANASAGLFWLEDLLGFYACAVESDSRATIPALPASPAPRSARRRRWLGAAAGTFWSCVSLASLRWRAGRNPSADSLDLAPGSLPTDGRIPGYSVAGVSLTREQTAQLVADSRARNWTVTAQLLESLARACFAVESRGRRLLVVLTTDRRRELPQADFTQPGNTTGSLTVQMLRARPLEPQVRAVLRDMRRGVPYWTNRLLDNFVRDELKLSAELPQELLKPMAERGAFESVGCVLTNAGVVANDSQLARACEWLTLSTRATMPLLAAVTVSGRMTLQITSPDALCDGATLRALLERLLTELSIDAPVSTDWRLSASD
ncbi:MAG: hypothetical protein DHS20C15_31740 [Planctomycetota bacterium]|nr:MAG: hypothetical protein DHS20C15_31740 [Planctomycetota bacterium]